jgi:HK97 family phage prohead protease
MPYEVVEERCEMADGTAGGFMIYKIEGEERTPFACHTTSENAYSVISRIEAEESKMMDEMKAFEEGQLVHWITEDEEGFGRVEGISDDSYTIRVYAQAGDEFEPTDRVMELPAEDVHDYMDYMLGEFDDEVDDLVMDMEDELESEDEDDLEEMAEQKQVDLQPTQEMADEAAQGLAWREEYGRGGTEVGVARARDISNRKNLSEDTVGRMSSYFARHAVDLEAEENNNPDADGYPGAGLIAWKLWGGDPGRDWADRKMAELEGEEKVEHEMKADPADLSVGDFVRWESGGGEAQGKIEEIRTEGTLNVPDSDFTLDASEEEPAYLIEVYERVEGGWRPSGVMVGHKADTLSKIEPLEIAEMKRRIIGRMKSIKAEMEETEDIKIGRIEGMASVYGNTDLGGDVVEKGAFKQTLNHSKIVPLLLDHNYSTAGVAGVAELEDGDKGLMLKAEMPLDVPEVMAAYKKIKFMIERGAKMGLSIGYDPVKTEPGVDGTRRLKELALHEVSITPFPMNTEAQIMAAKQAKRMAIKPVKAEMPRQTDAPDGNQPAEQDANAALVEQIEKVFKQALEDIKTQLTQGQSNEQ